MPLLYPKLRVTQVFGANTDVGKTLLTTSLLRSTAKLYKRQALESGSSAEEGKKVWYLKPVSTGPEDESDVSYVERNARRYLNQIKTKNLYQYREPVSPHLARQLAPDLDFPRTNDHLLERIRTYIETCSSSAGGSVYLETAGGVHSPSLHAPLTQIDSLRPLRLPTLLVASPHLGGISTTLSSYESLVTRGYTIDGVLGLEDGYYRNHEFLRDYFAERGIDFWSFEMPHSKAGLSVEEDVDKLDKWYDQIEDGKIGQSDNMVEVVTKLEQKHQARIDELKSMPTRTHKSIWWPFTQHGIINKNSDVMVIDSAKGDTFDAYYQTEESNKPAPESQSMLKPLFDGSASWFTQAHTHGHPRLTLAAAEAAGRYGHVLFPSGTHAPALQLAEKLLGSVGKGWAERVFYSDNGSTGMEVALKMALRSSGKRYGWDGVVGEDVGVIGLKGGYHGDTIGSMDASDQGIYNTAVDWYKGRGFWFSPPEVKVQNGRVVVNSTGNKMDWPAHPMKDGLAPNEHNAAGPLWSVGFSSLDEVYDVETRLGSELAGYYRSHIRTTLEILMKQTDPTTGARRRLGALVLEPMCLGAGGMVFVDPLFQKCLMDVVRESEDLFIEQEVKTEVESDGWRGLPVIFDEVFSGLHRLSYLSASEVLRATPDIAVYAKILSGGLLPLSTTLASNSIFKAFLHPTKKVEALLHGHSYTASPIACNVSLTALQMVEEQEQASKLGKGAWVEPKALWRADASDSSGLWSFWDKEFVYRISRSARVQGVMTLGTVIAIELKEDAQDGFGGYASSLALDFLTSLRQGAPISSDSSPFAPFHMHSRPLGNVVYVMTSLWTEREVVSGIEKAIERKLAEGW